MRSPRFLFRGAIMFLLGISPFPLAAQDAATAPSSGPLFEVDMTLIYAMVALAVVQVIFILSLSGIMRTMSRPGALIKRDKGHKGRAALLVPALGMIPANASAQAHQADGGTMSPYQLFWLLFAANLVLFVLLMAQLNLLRGLTRVVTGADEAHEDAPPGKGPTWLDKLMAKLTRQVAVEKEQDILMHHEYDGIRELDNVLPPWWVWLFYGSILWSVVYLFGAHVADYLPDQRTEYGQEMEQAKTDVAAYMSTLKSIVDENTVVASTDPADLATGGALFTQYCTPCHGADAAGSESSVGPNLTDAFWLHGGGVKNVFSTIKNGVPTKGMISWKAQLKPAEIAALASYILSLAGKGGPAQKAPQGDPWEAPDAAPDTMTMPPEVDTVRVALN